jgi:ATP-dependent RNA helicase SUPV3L1/SUV3
VLGSTTPPGSNITALLGPTNTGKTHGCVSRMLEYDSGMIGLPLRLLAREVYERIQREAGPDAVAFITGEERQVPRNARYWVCTTEAMPVEREVDFLAVDEVQLAASPTRGHIFTERLLHARGRFETWFLGASTMRSVIAQLVPTTQFRSAKRLSKLSFSGAIPLAKLPSRAAVVAFSTPRVYELAERLRVRKGGVAVVLGALSPKTRNAQVAMYQAGEVDHLVATDAIGMGLNMSLSHVALSAVHKFDGRNQRALSDAELAQIAGRAGRSIHDGTFGTLEPLHLNPHTAMLIEHHTFPPIRQLMWRNNNLDFSSVDTLFESLLVPPRSGQLRLVQQADDTSALQRLANNDRVRQLTSRFNTVRLLWDVCQIPDYRRLLPELHANLLCDIYERLVLSGGHLDNDWMAAKVAPLTTIAADIETLLAGLAAVRTWTYVSQRDDWVHEAKYWREHTRSLEERLSDALHERLIARFVVRTRSPSKFTASTTKTTRSSKVAPATTHVDHDIGVDPHHPFAALTRLQKPAQVRSVSAPVQTRLDWRVEPDGNIFCGERKVAVLRKGESLTKPNVVVTTSDSGQERSKLHHEALKTTRGTIEGLMRFAHSPDLNSPALRGLCYQLTSNLGVVLRRDTLDVLSELTSTEQAVLNRLGIVVGKHVVYAKELFRQSALSFRIMLVSLYFESNHPNIDPRRISMRRSATGPGDVQAALALGFLPAGPLWLRCDALERALMQAEDANISASVLCSSLGCKRRELDSVLRAVGLANSKFQLQ